MKRYLEIFVKARFATYLLDMQAYVVVFHIRFLLIKSSDLQRLCITRFCVLRAELYIGIESADDTAIFFNFYELEKFSILFH